MQSCTIHSRSSSERQLPVPPPHCSTFVRCLTRQTDATDDRPTARTERRDRSRAEAID